MKKSLRDKHSAEVLIDAFGKEVIEQLDDISARVKKLMNWTDEKTKTWMTSKNPNFGGISPEHMIMLGRYKKVLNFVLDAEDENGNVGR